MDAADRSSFRDRLREKLPEILIEACSVALAVMLALWASEWRDNRALDQDAALRKQAIVAELQGNRRELLTTLPAVEKNLAACERFLATPAGEIQSLQFDMRLSLLSTAAWNTAQAAESARRFDPGWVIPVAKAYELQALYQRQQEQVLDALAAIATADEDRPPSRQSVRNLAHQLRTLAQLNGQLSDAYDKRS